MPDYCIIQTEDGYTVVERGNDTDPVKVAEAHGGVLVDPGPYSRYDDALDAMTSVEEEITEDETSDVPAERPMEERYEVDDR